MCECVCAQSLSRVSLRPLDYSPPASSVHGTFQARILEWFAISSSRGSSWPRDRARVSCIASEIFTSDPLGKPITYIRLCIYDILFSSVACLSSGQGWGEIEGHPKFPDHLQEPHWFRGYSQSVWILHWELVSQWGTPSGCTESCVSCCSAGQLWLNVWWEDSPVSETGDGGESWRNAPSSLEQGMELMEEREPLCWAGTCLYRLPLQAHSTWTWGHSVLLLDGQWHQTGDRGHGARPFSSRDHIAPGGCGHVWGHFWLLQQPSRYCWHLVMPEARPGTLIHIPQCWGQPPAAETFPTLNVGPASTEKPRAGFRDTAVLWAQKAAVSWSGPKLNSLPWEHRVRTPPALRLWGMKHTLSLCFI